MMQPMYVVSRELTEVEESAGLFPAGTERLVIHMAQLDLDRYMQIKDVSGNAVWKIDELPDSMKCCIGCKDKCVCNAYCHCLKTKV